MKIFLIILISIVFIACETVQQDLKDDVYYDRDIMINDYKIPGVAILPRQDSYKITLKSYPKINFGNITTCHRDRNFWNDKNEYTLDYIPVKGIEDTNCDIMLMTAQKGDKQNVYAFGHIIIADPQFQLKAVLSCNGEVEEFTGQSICKFKKGLIQQIKFYYPVEASPVAECPSLTTEDKKIYRFSDLPVGTCSYTFRDSNFGKDVFHKLTVDVYEGILIRR